MRRGAGKKHLITSKWYKKLNASLSYPDKSRPYQMSPKFLVNVILRAWPPDSMTSFERRQYPNAVIGARYPNAVI